MDSGVSTDHPQLQRTISLTDLDASSAIRDTIERDLTVPADRTKCRFFLELPKHNFILPSVTRFDHDFRQFLLSVLVDSSLMKEMEDSRCLNWCSVLPKFLPLQTLGDGNCLMHAASLGMWAVQDRRLTLRKSVYQVLIEDQTDIFRKRWQLEQEKQLEEQHGSQVDCSNEQWNDDWKKTVNLASTTKSPENNVFNGLEGIHIFVLANILRRPILVLCDDVHRGNYDESLADVNLGGIYLPLLCDSVDCVKSPLVIGYHQGHFMALVTTEDGSATGEDASRTRKAKHGVPLVRYDDSEMQLHFLLPEEQQHSDRLLREYLNCSKVEYTNNEVTRTILVATMQLQDPEAHLDQMFKTYFGALQEVYLEKLAEKQHSLCSENYRPHRVAPPPSDNHAYLAKGRHQNTFDDHRCCTAHKKCKNAVCENYTTLTNDHCHQCRKIKAQLCTSPGCSFIANPDTEGLCSTCFTRFRAILDQGMVAPSAPPSNRCTSGNCQNMASALFRSKCYDCYLQYIHESDLTGLAQTASSQANSEHTVESKVNNEKQTEKQFVPRVPIQSPIQPQQNCFNQTCTNALQNSEQIYCESCSPPQTPVHSPEPSNNNCNPCRISGCGLAAVTYHVQLCYQHYKESLPHYQSKNEQVDKPLKVTRCITTGCNFYAVPDHNYLCSQCYVKALQEEYDLKKIKAEQDRAQAEWIAQLAGRSDRFQFDHCNTSRKPFYIEAISTPNRSASAPPSPNPRRSAADQIPCVTKGCPSLATKKTQGLCDNCFKKKEVLLYQETGRRERFCSTP